MQLCSSPLQRRTSFRLKNNDACITLTIKSPIPEHTACPPSDGQSTLSASSFIQLTVQAQNTAYACALQYNTLFPFIFSILLTFILRVFIASAPPYKYTSPGLISASAHSRPLRALSPSPFLCAFLFLFSLCPIHLRQHRMLPTNDIACDFVPTVGCAINNCQPATPISLCRASSLWGTC